MKLVLGFLVLVLVATVNAVGLSIPLQLHEYSGNWGAWGATEHASDTAQMSAEYDPATRVLSGTCSFSCSSSNDPSSSYGAAEFGYQVRILGVEQTAVSKSLLRFASQTVHWSFELPEGAEVRIWQHMTAGWNQEFRNQEIRYSGWTGGRLDPNRIEIKETATNSGPMREYYQWFGSDAGGNLTPIGDPIVVNPYSSTTLTMSSDDLAGTVVLGKLSDVAEGSSGVSYNWLSAKNSDGTAAPLPTGTSAPTGSGPIVGANGDATTATTGGINTKPITFEKTSGAADAIDKGTASTVYGVGIVANGLLQQIADNTKKAADAVDDTRGETAPEEKEEPSNPLEIDAERVKGLSGKLPTVPTIKMPGMASVFIVPLDVPKLGRVSGVVDLTRYDAPISVFRVIVAGALALWFFFMVVKAVKQAVAN